MTARRLNVVSGWALRDLLVDWRMTLLSVLLLAGLAVSPLVLHVVRVGVIDGWIQSLGQDPRNREVIVVSERHVTSEILAEIAAWPETGFVIPEPTTFISSVRLQGPRGIDALDMRTSGPGDPILGQTPAPDAQSVTLTREAADLLGVGIGDKVALIGSRVPRSSPRQVIAVPVTVAGIVPETTWGGRIAFLTPERAAGLTDWIAKADGPPLPPGADATLRAPRQGPWRGLRVYATDIGSVASLRDRMRAAGFDVRLDTDQVARMMRLSEALDRLATTILWVGAVVFALAALSLQLLSITRRCREVALMSAAGLSLGDIAFFFGTQCAVVTATGLAVAAVMVVPARGLARELAASIAGAAAVPPLAPGPILLAGAVALGVSVCVSVLASSALRRLNVAKLLRGD